MQRNEKKDTGYVLETILVLLFGKYVQCYKKKKTHQFDMKEMKTEKMIHV